MPQSVFIDIMSKRPSKKPKTKTQSELKASARAYGHCHVYDDSKHSNSPANEYDPPGSLTIDFDFILTKKSTQHHLPSRLPCWSISRSFKSIPPTNLCSIHITPHPFFSFPKSTHHLQDLGSAVMQAAGGGGKQRKRWEVLREYEVLREER